MSKLIILIVICVAIFIGFSLYSTSTKQSSTNSTSEFKTPQKGIERAQYLIKLSPFADSIKEDEIVYVLPADDITSSQGYSINSEIYFSLYDLKDISKASVICEEYKRVIALENTQTYCSTNGTTLFLGYAPINKKSILDNLVSSFAGEE